MFSFLLSCERAQEGGAGALARSHTPTEHCAGGVRPVNFLFALLIEIMGYEVGEVTESCFFFAKIEPVICINIC